MKTSKGFVEPTCPICFGTVSIADMVMLMLNVSWRYFPGVGTLLTYPVLGLVEVRLL